MKWLSVSKRGPLQKTAKYLWQAASKPTEVGNQFLGGICHLEHHFVAVRRHGNMNLLVKNMIIAIALHPDVGEVLIFAILADGANELLSPVTLDIRKSTHIPPDIEVAQLFRVDGEDGKVDSRAHFKLGEIERTSTHRRCFLSAITPTL